MLSKLCPLLKGIEPLSLDSEVVQKEFQSLHVLTAGWVRAMHALRQGDVEYSELLDLIQRQLPKRTLNICSLF